MTATMAPPESPATATATPLAAAKAAAAAAATSTSTTAADTPSAAPPGAGHLHLSHAPRAHFSTQRAAYPLKLLTPNSLPSQPQNVRLAYSLAYGGGLVAGDLVQLDVKVDDGCGLVLLTQGSTKVFKHRPGMRPKSHQISRIVSAGDGPAPTTRQRLHIALEPGAFLLLMPDSLSPFRASSYAQAQRVTLPADGSASALVLDWVNSGRGARAPAPMHSGPPGGVRDLQKKAAAAAANGAAAEGAEAPAGVPDDEVWAMAYYSSTNEIVVGDEVIARERMVLDNRAHDTGDVGSGLSPAAVRLAPYHVYATVLLEGPHFAQLRAHMDKVVDGTSQFQLPRPPGLLWSYSSLSDTGGIIRVAGLEVEDVRDWLRAALTAGGVNELVGQGLWPRCI
ncbi:Urease accessory protein D [Vanrija pseudolonga]|uniref:Urease accessory protein D n=1 Tax=Vanrija pseudolonga TaxID=143232 RepID=A0AAF0Y0B1_9TREE|nr:Urease accessory protein D [Vanrija pseudolonga]